MNPEARPFVPGSHHQDVDMEETGHVGPHEKGHQASSHELEPRQCDKISPSDSVTKIPSVIGLRRGAFSKNTASDGTSDDATRDSTHTSTDIPTGEEVSTVAIAVPAMGTNALETVVTRQLQRARERAGRDEHVDSNRIAETDDLEQKKMDEPQPSTSRPQDSQTNRSTESDGRTSGKRKRIDRDTKPGDYRVVMKPKTRGAPDATKILREAIKGVRVQIVERQMKGADTHFKFLNREHAMTVLSRLEEYMVGTMRATQIYHVFMKTGAGCSIRTEAFSTEVYKRLQFLDGGKVNHQRAVAALVNHNPIWFESEGAIELVELHKVGGRKRDRFILAIHVTSGTYKKFLKNTKAGRATIDTGMDIVAAYAEFKDDRCFKCLQPGHRMNDCKGPTVCKFCGVSNDHLSMDCQVKREGLIHHECITCKRENEARPVEQQVDTNHAATTARCPAERRLQKERSKRERAAAVKPQYGGRND